MLRLPLLIPGRSLWRGGISFRMPAALAFLCCSRRECGFWTPLFARHTPDSAASSRRWPRLFLSFAADVFLLPSELLYEAHVGKDFVRFFFGLVPFHRSCFAKATSLVYGEDLPLGNPSLRTSVSPCDRSMGPFSPREHFLLRSSPLAHATESFPPFLETESR